MNIQNIINRFVLLSGVSAKESEEFSGFCSEAKDYIQSITNTDTESESVSALLENAAAAFSFYKYTLYLAGSGKLSGFSAGDVSVDGTESTVKYALELWLQSRSQISDYIVDKGNDFAFIST